MATSNLGCGPTHDGDGPVNLTNERAGQITGGVWLIGLGLLFATGRWWPGIMFLIGVSAIVEGLVEGRGWYAFQAGFWSIMIGVWALYHYSLPMLFVGLGVSMIVMAIAPPPMFAKPKPFTDNSLE